MANNLIIQHWKVGLLGEQNELTSVESLQTEEQLIAVPTALMGPGFIVPEVQYADFSDTSFLVINYYYERKEYEVIVDHVAVGPRLETDPTACKQIKFLQTRFTLKYGESSGNLSFQIPIGALTGFERGKAIDITVDGVTTIRSIDESVTQGLSQIAIQCRYYPIQYVINPILPETVRPFSHPLTYNALAPYTLPKPEVEEGIVVEYWMSTGGIRIDGFNLGASTVFESVDSFVEAMDSRETGDVDIKPSVVHIVYFLAIHHNYYDDQIEEIAAEYGKMFELPLLARRSFVQGNYTVSFAGTTASIPPVTTEVSIAYKHTGYNTKSDGTGIQYNIGDQIPAYDDIVLFATWQQIYTGHVPLPEISSQGGSRSVSVRMQHEVEDLTTIHQLPVVIERKLIGWRATTYYSSLPPGYNFLPSSDVTFEAVWEDTQVYPTFVLSQLPAVESALEHVVTLDPGEGTLSDDQKSLKIPHTQTWRQSAWCSDEARLNRKWSLGQTVTVTKDMDICATGYIKHHTGYATLPVPTHASKRFVGWSLTENGAPEYGPNRAFTTREDVTLYAVYADADSHIVEYVPPEGYEFTDFPSVLVVASEQSCQITPSTLPKSLDKLIIDRTFTVRGTWSDEDYNYVTAEMYARTRNSERVEGKFWEDAANGTVYPSMSVVTSLDHDLILKMVVNKVSTINADGAPLSDFNTPTGTKVVDGAVLVLKDSDKTTISEIIDSATQMTHVESWMFEEYWSPEVETVPNNYRSTNLISEDTDSINLWANIIVNQTANTVILPIPTKAGNIFLGWTQSLDSKELEPGYFVLDHDAVLYAVWHQFEWDGYSAVRTLRMSVEDNSIGSGIIGEMLIGLPGEATVSEIDEVVVFDGEVWQHGQLLVGTPTSDFTNELDSGTLDSMILG